MPWFTPEFTKFFSQLRKNNNKAWFDANKAQYEKVVKAPFELFIAEMIKRVGKIDPGIRTTPKEAIYRIYKDVRFSKDKTPYKDYASALLGHSGKKDMETPGFYLSLNDKGVEVATGAYMLEKEYLHRVRLAIAAKPKEFSKIITAKEFLNLFGEVKGEKNKKLVPELVEDAAKQPLIYNKQFYIGATLDPKLITSDKLIDELLKYFKAAEPFNQFLVKVKDGK